MKSSATSVLRFVVLVACVVAINLAGDVSRCHAQFGFFGRGKTAARGAFKQPRFGSAYGANPADHYGINAASSPAYGVASQYRGIQPTQAELDREKFYYNLDRMHRYQTREERYANDFYNAYASPAAMVDRYRYPYVAGTPNVPWTPKPVPGLTLGRYESRYQGYVADDEVAESLRAAANRLQRSLSQKSDGYVWVRHLRPDLIIATIDRGEHPGILTDLVLNYEAVADEPRLVLISESVGFQDVRRLLAQYVTLQSLFPRTEAIVEEPVFGESSFDPMPMSTSDLMLLPPSLPIPLPSDAADSLSAPMLNSLPDEANVELLPAPLPTPAE